MTRPPLAQDDRIGAGRLALERAAWQEARTLFESALAEAETPEALEGLGAAAWWLNDVGAVFAARERAYRLYRMRQDNRAAARVAAALAMDHCTFRGETALASGWVRRAERLLEGEACGELGWLSIVKAHMALMIDHDPAAAHRLAAEARSLGGSLNSLAPRRLSSRQRPPPSRTASVASRKCRADRAIIPASSRCEWSIIHVSRTPELLRRPAVARAVEDGRRWLWR